MSKAAAIAATGVGGGGAAVGGYIIFTNTGSGKGEEAKEEQQSNTPTLELDKKLEEFKKDKNAKCIKDFFSTSDLDFTLPTDSSDLPASDTSFFGNPTQDAAKNKSCLQISVDKTTYTVGDSTKWSGTFSWTWSFLNNDKGFITFNLASTSPHDKSLHLVGGFYLLSKETESGQEKWKIKHYKEIKEADKKTIDSSTFPTNFPKAKEGSDVFKKESKDYWDYAQDATDLDKICGKDECKETGTPKKTEHKYKWSWKANTAENTNKLGEWSNDWKWWEFLYGKSTFDLEEKLKDFTGKWESEDNAPAA